MPPSKPQHHFHGPYHPQSCLLPDTLIYYITQNPSSTKVYRSLIKSCKYFFSKNPISIMDRLCLSPDFASLTDEQKSQLVGTFFNKARTIMDLEKLSYKLWITQELTVTNPNLPSSSVFPRLYRCDVIDMDLSSQDMTYNELLFLSSNVENITFDHITVKKEDGSIVPFEKIFKAFPKVKRICFGDHDSVSSITNNTVKKILELPNFPKLDKFEMFNIPETFDIKTFYTFLKANKHTTVSLYFSESISEGYKNQIELFIDKIIRPKYRRYKVPLIRFEGIAYEKWLNIRSLYLKSNR